ncbi:hypothetical protein [Erythrobacter sp. Alg231-14]|uniref:hypothetical protein n=1 Tax=Erythrobacter sp. Alg231-14 TaxID=1922225 RepID=UPI000D554DE6
MIQNLPPLAHLTAISTLAIFASATSACHSGRSGNGSVLVASTVWSPDPPAFVEAACADCHSVEPAFLSPNPNAPSFASIANREGLTDDTLSSWLINAHNYPEVMDFDLRAKQAELVADYIISLKREDYVPEQ